MKKINRINSRLGKWSFVISLIALIVSIYFGFQSYISIQEQIKLEEKSMLSKVVAQIKIDYSQDKVVFEQADFGDSKAIYKQKYILVLNNLGQVDASITDMSLSLESKMYNSEIVGYGSFHGMGPWYYDTQGNKLDLPISIEPNKPKKITVKVGVIVPIEAWEKLPDSVQFNQVYNYNKIEDKFLEIGHPFMGQLDLIDNGYGDKGNLQKYHLTITKGDGKRVKVWFLHNVSDHLQGEKD